MIYFIPWVVFLLAVVLAVPVVSMLEKRRMSPPPDDAVADDEEAVFEGEAEEAGEVVEVAEDGADPFGTEFGAPGGDDFSAFDQEFK